VDAAFNEMQKQIAGLEIRRQVLSDVIAQYNEKIEQIEASTKNIEAARTRESLRVAGVLDKALWAAGETEQEANQKAASIINAAQSEAQDISAKALKDVEAAWNILALISQDMQVVKQINQQFYTHLESTLNGLDVLLKETLNEISCSVAASHLSATTPPPPVAAAEPATVAEPAAAAAEQPAVAVAVEQPAAAAVAPVAAAEPAAAAAAAAIAAAAAVGPAAEPVTVPVAPAPSAGGAAPMGVPAPGFQRPGWQI